MEHVRSLISWWCENMCL